MDNSDTTLVTPKDIPTNSATDKNVQFQTISPFISQSVGVPMGHGSASTQKAKKELKTRSFIPKWYVRETIYSDNTLYNKVGRSQMEAFLAGEGVDVTETFMNATYPRYVERGRKRVKINKGQAIVEMVQVVHQRVIDRKKAGFAVGPNQSPDLGAEDLEVENSAFDRETGPAAAAVVPGNLFNASHKQGVFHRVKGNDQALATERKIQGPQVRENGNKIGGVLSATAPDVLVPPGSRSVTATTSSPHVWPEHVFVQRLDQLRQDLIVIKMAIMSELETGTEAVENAETASTTHNLNNDKAAQQAQVKITELDRLIRDSHGQLVISVEVQGLVRSIIDAAIRFHDTERRFKAGDGSKGRLLKEGRDANNEYQRARSDLMQRLAADILWDRSVRRGGYRVADIVLEVLPAKPLEVLK